MIINKPIGMEPLVSEVKKICENSEVYRLTPCKPNHFIIYLNKGEGRSTALEYISNMFKANGVLDFYTGLDDHIEFTFDGTYNNYIEGEQLFEDAAIYENAFAAPFGIDAAMLCSHKNEDHWNMFTNMISTKAKSAFFVFFISLIPSKNEEELIKTVKKHTKGRITEIVIPAYSKSDYHSIAIRKVKDCVTVCEDKKTKTAISNFLDSQNINSVTKAISAAELIVTKAKCFRTEMVIDSECFNVSEKERQSYEK